MIRLEVLNPHENHGMGETDDSISYSEVGFSGESHNSVSGSAITECRLTLDVIYSVGDKRRFIGYEPGST